MSTKKLQKEGIHRRDAEAAEKGFSLRSLRLWGEVVS